MHAPLKDEFVLDPAVTFLNHGSFGAAPRQVLDVQSSLRLELEANPVEFLARQLPGRLASVRCELASYLGVPDVEGLVLVPNVTTGLNAVARSLPLDPGDEIVLTDHEYGAMRLLWDEVAGVHNATIKTIEIPFPYTGPDVVVERFRAAITDRTKALFFSHITSLSALVLPAELLCQLAREHSVISIVDGAHAPGQLPLDLGTIDPDCYAGNAHKWMCAPKGAGFLYAGSAARRWIRGDTVSWGWTWEGSAAFEGRFSWRGTTDPTALLSIPAAIAFQRDHDWPQIQPLCQDVARRAGDRLERALGATRVAAEEHRSPQMISVALPPAADRFADGEIQRRLRVDHGIELPVERFLGRTVARVSVQAYNSEAECGLLSDSLSTILDCP